MKLATIFGHENVAHITWEEFLKVDWPKDETTPIPTVIGSYDHVDAEEQDLIEYLHSIGLTQYHWKEEERT